MSKQATIARIRQHFPQAAVALDQWVTWRLEARNDKPTKVPYSVQGYRAASDNPATWASFDAACNAYLNGNYNGVGLVFSQHDRFAGIDFDDCVSGGAITDSGKASYVKRLDSYSEYSQSGKGVHTIAIGQLPGQGRNDQTRGVEMYDRRRFFVVTGNHVPGTPATVNERQHAITTLYHEVWPTVQPKATHRAPAATGAILQDDQELLRRMFASRNGATIEALWRGDLGKYASQSEADLALCSHLAFWTGNDTARIDRLFCQSGLHRDKWERAARQAKPTATAPSSGH